MSNIAIRAEGLSKRYRLGRRQEPYRTLRETFAHALAHPFRRAARSFGRTSADPAADDIWALKDVSFDVRQGDVVGVIGRNGAGKSTLLKILSRITDPTAGRADVRGRIGCLLEVGSGFHPELTGRENVFLNGAILGMRRAEIERNFDEIVAFAEVERFIDTPVKRYSSGMYLRLAFAVAAHLEPEILVVDEVLAVGDQAFQNKCLNKMQDVSGEGRTVLFVSHNMAAIHRLCGRSLLLDEGRIIADGDTSDVVEAYLSTGREHRAEYVQPHDPTKPINLRRAALTNADGDVASEVRYDQGFRVVVDYEVTRPVAQCSLWMAVNTAENVCAFDSADTDVLPTLLTERVPGCYRSTVEVPPRWLNIGRHYLVVGIANLAHRISYDRIEFAAFNVLEIGTPDVRRGGVLAPYLPWQTVRQSREDPPTLGSSVAHGDQAQGVE